MRWGCTDVLLCSATGLRVNGGIVMAFGLNVEHAGTARGCSHIENAFPHLKMRLSNADHRPFYLVKRVLGSGGSIPFNMGGRSDGADRIKLIFVTIDGILKML